MRKLLTHVTLTGLMFGLAACGQENSGNDQAAANADSNASANQMAMNDPNNPYSQAEMQMHERMMAAQGTNPSETWVKKMIEHHRGAVEMSNVLIQQGGDPKVLEIARRTAQEQQREIEELERMLSSGATAPAPVTTAATTASKPAAPAERRDAAPSGKAKAESPREAPKAEPKAAPKSESKAAPKAAPATPTCTAEHRAMGHC